MWGVLPSAPFQAEPGDPLPGLTVSPRAEATSLLAVQKLGVAVATAAAVGGAGGEGGSSCCFWQLSQMVIYCAWWLLNA